jgi:hypothetical protein
MRLCANDEEYRLKKAGCPPKKTGSRSIVLSQRSPIAWRRPIDPAASCNSFVKQDYAA